MSYDNLYVDIESNSERIALLMRILGAIRADRIPDPDGSLATTARRIRATVGTGAFVDDDFGEFRIAAWLALHEDRDDLDDDDEVEISNVDYGDGF